MSDLGHWLFDGVVPDNPYGFIYIITNTQTNRSYIGKKQIIRKVKKAPLRGKSRKRTVLKESDWKVYTSSSCELNADILQLGIDKFQFKILRFCYSKWELAYYEAKAQFDNNVLLSNDFYNGIINLRIGRPPSYILKECED